jgi:hypothetical protein
MRDASVRYVCGAYIACPLFANDISGNREQSYAKSLVRQSRQYYLFSSSAPVSKLVMEALAKSMMRACLFHRVAS